MLSIRDRLDMPVIACVDGVATAAGFQLVASSDLVVASTTSKFATSGINVGLFCSTPMVAISRNIPPKVMFELLATGDYISAQRLEQLGFINRLVESSEVEAEALKLARQIVSKGMSTKKFGKRAFYNQLEEPRLRNAYGIGTEAILRNALGSEAIQGIEQFSNKKTKL